MPRFERDLLLGRIGEHVVERVLSRSNFQVIPYGYERVALSAIDVLKFARSEIAIRIRSAPDFLVLNSAGEPFLIQVKTTISRRRYLTLSDSSHPEKQHWPQAIFFLVNLSQEQRGIYAVERWGKNAAEDHVFVYYDEDHPANGCSKRIEDFEGLGQTVPRDIVEDVMDAALDLVSPISKNQNAHLKKLKL